MTKRRKFPSFNKQVALAALRGDKTIQELAAHHRLHPNQISQWKRQAVDGLDGVFTGKSERAAVGIARGCVYPRNKTASVSRKIVATSFHDRLKKQQIITATPKGAPILQSQGVVNGVYQWVLGIPLVLTYRSGVETVNTELLVTVIVKRPLDPNIPTA